MEIILSVFYTALFCLLIYKLPFFKINGISPLIFIAVFIVKLLSALALTLIYTYYYTDRATADIFKYFDDAKVIFGALQTKPYDYVRMVSGIGSNSPDLYHYYSTCRFWFKAFDYRLFNDNRTIIRFNAIVMLFSFGTFFVHNIFMSFLSLVGLTGIFKVFVQKYPAKQWLLLVAIYLLPSVLLWSSGLLKEGLLLFALGLFFYYLWNSMFYKPTAGNIVGMAVMVCILSIVKYYVLLCLMPGILYLLLARFAKMRHLLAFALSFSLCTLILFVNHRMGDNHDVIATISNKQNDFVNYVHSLNDVGSLIQTDKLKPSLLDFLKHTPRALFTSLFKPFLWDVHTVLTVLPALENLLLVVLLLLAIYFRSKQQLSIELLLFSLSFALCLNILNGLTVPIYGALVRYKVPAMPFLFASLVCWIDVF